MKKLIKSARALATLLFAASCQQENLEPAQSDSTVNFSVEVPGVATKAVGDDVSNINDLVYAVYRTKGSSLEETVANWDEMTDLVYQINPKGTVFNN